MSRGGCVCGCGYMRVKTCLPSPKHRCYCCMNMTALCCPSSPVHVDLMDRLGARLHAVTLQYSNTLCPSLGMYRQHSRAWECLGTSSTQEPGNVSVLAALKSLGMSLYWQHSRAWEYLCTGSTQEPGNVSVQAALKSLGMSLYWQHSRAWEYLGTGSTQEPENVSVQAALRATFCPQNLGWRT